MPHKLQKLKTYADRIAVEMMHTGASVDSMPTDSPAMMFVAAPVVEASAMLRTGRYM